MKNKVKKLSQVLWFSHITFFFFFFEENLGSLSNLQPKKKKIQTHIVTNFLHLILCFKGMILDIMK